MAAKPATMKKIQRQANAILNTISLMRSRGIAPPFSVSSNRSRRVVVDDLPAIIAARDPPERGAKRLAVHRLLDPCELQRRRVAARAAQDRRDQRRIEVRQGRPEA